MLAKTFMRWCKACWTVSELAPGAARRLLPIFGLWSLVAVESPQRAEASDRLTRIELRHVKVGGEIGRRIDVTVENNLLVMDVQRDFLAPFQKKDRGGGYIGLGKTIDAAVRFAAYTGDDRVMALKKRLVQETVRAQEPDGYIGIMQPARRMWTLWDIHEMGYIVYGLASDHRFFGEQVSLKAAKKLADYIVAAWSTQPERKPGGGRITVHLAVTGVESAILALYQQTGDRRYLDFCVELRKLPAWDARIVTGRWGQIEGHAYAHVCRCIAQLRLNRISPQARLLKPTRDVIDFLIRQDGLVITGTCGDHECWHDTQEGTINLGETCATAYLIRLTDELLRMQRDPLYGDLMERAIYNALFAAQSPDGRRIRYYTPFDGPRVYFKGDTYCCPCNYRRIIAELPQMIYYRADGNIAKSSYDGVLVNLYTPSTARIQFDQQRSVKVRQETDYPHSGEVVLHVEPSRPVEFPLWLRIPRWCRRAKVTVNGQPTGRTASRGSWFTIERRWEPGDRVRLELPMDWRLVKGRKAQAGRVAVMRGPLVFCLNRARHEKLAGVDLRLITIDPASLEGPLSDDSVHASGQACRLRAWGPGRWYPMAKPDLSLVLTEFPDPGGEATYFKVPNPSTEMFVDDELIQLDTRK